MRVGFRVTKRVVVKRRPIGVFGGLRGHENVTVRVCQEHVTLTRIATSVSKGTRLGGAER